MTGFQLSRITKAGYELIEYEVLTLPNTYAIS